MAADSPYWYLAAALFVIGLGLGATIMPSMGAAYAGLTHAQMPRATSAINAIQRIAGSLGTALLAVVLQRAIRGELPRFHGGLAQAGALAARDPEHAPAALASAFGTTFWFALGLTVAALVPALLLPKRMPA